MSDGEDTTFLLKIALSLIIATLFFIQIYKLQDQKKAAGYPPLNEHTLAEKQKETERQQIPKPTYINEDVYSK